MGDDGMGACGGGLQMKLQADDVRADLKGLVFAGGAACEMDCACGQIKGFTVPVKDVRGFGESKCAASMWHCLDVIPAYLTLFASVC